MSELEIRLADERTGLEPGDEVGGVVTWQRAEAPQSLELRLFWWTSGRGSRDLEIVARQMITDLDLYGERPFRFRLPTAPCSFSGELITLAWGLELIVEPDGDSARRDLVVGPGGHELDISGQREW